MKANAIRTSLFGAMTILAIISTVNARASDSPDTILSTTPPAVAFARYIAFLNQRNLFTESGPVAVQIHASLPGEGKEASLTAIGGTGTSERTEYEVLKVEGDPTVAKEVIARYLSARAQLEELPLSSILITPANYNFRYAGSNRSAGMLLYVFEISPRQNRLGLLQGELWIDPDTGVPVHQAGRFVKTPSPLLRRIDVVCDVNLADGSALMRITHAVLEMRQPKVLAELTIAEWPLSVPEGESGTIARNRGGRP